MKAQKNMVNRIKEFFFNKLRLINYDLYFVCLFGYCSLLLFFVFVGLNSDVIYYTESIDLKAIASTFHDIKGNHPERNSKFLPHLVQSKMIAVDMFFSENGGEKIDHIGTWIFKDEHSVRIPVKKDQVATLDLIVARSDI